MAGFFINAVDLRPCLIGGKSHDVGGNIFYNHEPNKGLFHFWHPDGKAIVEYEDGLVEAVPVDFIQFLDSKGRFEQYCWDKKPKDEVHTCTTCKYDNTSAYSIDTPCFECSDEDDKWEPKEGV